MAILYDFVKISFLAIVQLLKNWRLKMFITVHGRDSFSLAWKYYEPDAMSIKKEDVTDFFKLSRNDDYQTGINLKGNKEIYVTESFDEVAALLK